MQNITQKNHNECSVASKRKRHYDSKTLFGDAQEVFITHENLTY
ncbi:hypothetical protein ME5_01016 [Bartonella tamiae Th239]|uniref:Uncharacterized protein n=1 Tax=Bartonella tamiae Th239 TaxID=1094558 RepID=J1K0Q1_9HYPH|nr:hypothetical protein ME5_01016 [Bartonella tamiae Th239]